MTLTRGLTVSALALLATVVLVGLCGVPGLLVWLGVVALAACVPNWCWNVAANFQLRAAVRWTVDTWRWLDRRW